MSNAGPLAVKYVGKKPVKTDTVAGTTTIWSGNGDIQIVEHLAAVKLLQYPNVWVSADKKEQAESSENKDTVAAAKVPDSKPAPKSEEPKPADLMQGGVATVDEIVAAILTLSTDNKAHFTPSGSPKKAAIVAALSGKTIGSMKDVNAAWTQVQGN